MKKLLLWTSLFTTTPVFANDMLCWTMPEETSRLGLASHLSGLTLRSLGADQYAVIQNEWDAKASDPQTSAIDRGSFSCKFDGGHATFQKQMFTCSKPIDERSQTQDVIYVQTVTTTYLTPEGKQDSMREVHLEAWLRQSGSAHLKWQAFLCTNKLSFAELVYENATQR